MPPPEVVATFPAGTGIVFTFLVKSSTGIDLATGGRRHPPVRAASSKARSRCSPWRRDRVPDHLRRDWFSLNRCRARDVRKSRLAAFVGVGVEGKIGPLKAYAFLGVGFRSEYDVKADVTRYGGLVALEAGSTW